MGCKVLDLLPLTNKPDLEVVQKGIRAIQENTSKIEMNEEYLRKFFSETYIDYEKDNMDKNFDSRVAKATLAVYNEITTYMTEPVNADGYSQPYSFLCRHDSHVVDATERGFDMFIKSLDFSKSKADTQTNTRYQLIVNNLPRANMKDVRTLAANLHMVIIPVEFSHPKVLFGDDEKLNNMFNLFNSNTDDDLYVMCPVNFYNHYRHITSKSEKEMFIPEKFQSVFDTLEMTRSTLGFILDKIDENSQEIVALNKRVENLANRVDILENIEIERREEQKRRAMEFKYRNLDPMIINIPKGEDVNSWDGETKIHMLWGDDLPDILTENKKLQVFKENKNAYPDKIYDFVEKAGLISAPSIRFKYTEQIVERFYKNGSTDAIHHYKQYCDATGTYYSGYDADSHNAIRNALKIIRAQYVYDIQTLTEVNS